MESTSISNGKGSNSKDLQDHISRLPLDCLRTVIQLTSPKDACRCATVCTTFQSVANSNYVWESFLPADLSSILYHSKIDVQQLPISKKELYLHLCHNWILLDGGMKSLRLDLSSGAKIILLHKQHPSIKDPIETPINIKGEIQFKDLSPETNYAPYMIFTGKSYSRILRIIQFVYDSSSGHNPLYAIDIWRQESQIREDGWREIKLEEFNTGVTEVRAMRFIIYDKYTYIYMTEVLSFIGIEVRPVC